MDDVNNVNSWIPALVVGAILLVIGFGMMFFHYRSWQRQQEDDSLDEFDREHYLKRFRRRMQTSGLLALMGILIPFGDAPFFWNQRDQFLSSIFWLIVLVMLMWIILLAVGDLTSSRMHGNVALARLRQRQRELEAQVAELKRRDGNGQH